MRVSLIAATAAVLLAPALAAADPAPVGQEDADVAAAALAVALDRDDDRTVKDLFAATVRVQGLAFTDAACTRAFGGKKKRTIAKKAHAKLAACVVDAGWSLGVPPPPVHEGAVWHLVAQRSRDRLMVELVQQKDGRMKLAALRGTPPEVVQPVKVERTDREVIEDPDAGVEGGVADGVVGGDLAGAPPPPPPPPPPPAPPQNVSPTVLEGIRIAGDKLIIPDEDTKTAIGKSGKSKIVGSFKLCIGATGAPTSVTKLKSTGFAAYDTDLVAGITTWRYRPYLVNGRPTPVCTAVTFIYSQQ